MMNPAITTTRAQQPIMIGSQMNYSQTMPQLNYTQHDIREQYNMTSSVNFGASTSHLDPITTGDNDTKRMRAQSCDSKRGSSKFGTTSRESDQWSDHDEDDDRDRDDPKSNNPSQQQQQHGARTRTRQEDRKRTRRPRSASLFSSCFHISNLSQQIPARKLKILSHFGLAPSNLSASSNNSGQRSTIRESKTMGHLQQYANSDANDENHWPPSSGQRTKALGAPQQSTLVFRKHVSFGRQQQQQNTLANINNNDNNLTTNDDNNNQHGQMKPYAQQQYSNNSNSNLIRAPLQGGGSSSSSTVIMRNYQAHMRPDNNSNNHTNVNASSGNNAVDCNNHNNSSPLASMSSYNNQQQQSTSAITRQPTGFQQQQQPPAGHLMNNENMDNYEAQSTLLNQRQINNNNITTITPNKSAQIKTRAPGAAGANCAAPPLQVQPKRVPLPTRTQATQTDITAYHLMLATPSSSTGSTLHRAKKSSEKSPTPINLRRSHQQQQQHDLAHNFAANKCGVETAAARQLGKAGSSDSCGSNSSLAGHDSALANRLGLVPTCESPTEWQASRVVGTAAADNNKTLQQGGHDNELAGSKTEAQAQSENVDVVATRRAYPSSSSGRSDHDLNALPREMQTGSRNEEIASVSSRGQLVENKQGGVLGSIKGSGLDDLSASLIARDDGRIIKNNHDREDDDLGEDLNEYFASLDPPSEFKDLNTRELVAKKLKLTSESQLHGSAATRSCSQLEEGMVGQVQGNDVKDANDSNDNPSCKQHLLQRFESQPSLSEASSQTDASLAPNIKTIELGRRVSSSICSRAVRQETTTTSVINGHESAPSGGGEQDWARTMQEGYATLHTDDSNLTPVKQHQDSSFHRTPSATSSSSSSPSLTSTSSSLSGSKMVCVRSKSGKSSSKMREELRTVATGDLNGSSQTLINEASPARHLDRDRDDDDSCDLINDDDQQEQEQRQQIQVAGSGAISPSANQRRDDFLQLDELELEASLQVIEKVVAASPPAPSSTQQQQQQQQQALSRKLSSTSTLSTRHHSYCSSDEFAAPPGPPPLVAPQQQQENTSQSLSNPASTSQIDAGHLLCNEEGEDEGYFDVGRNLALGDPVNLHGGDACSIFPQDSNLTPQDDEEATSMMPISCNSESDKQHQHQGAQDERQRRRASDLARIASSDEIDCTELAVAKGDEQRRASIIIASSMALVAQENGDQDCQLKLEPHLGEAAQKANQEAGRQESAPNDGSGAIMIADEAAPGGLESSASSASSASSNCSTNQAGRNMEAREDSESLRGGVDEGRSQANSPMTVSELDELSTPSFLDYSYKGHYEQQVSLLAEQVVDRALDESIEQPEPASRSISPTNLNANLQDVGQTRTACNARASSTKPGPSDGRSVAFKESPRPTHAHALGKSASSSSSSSTNGSTSTSIDGTERECCAHSSSSRSKQRASGLDTSRPPVPKKPAHLRADAQLEASGCCEDAEEAETTNAVAAAVAVTATTIAAAAARKQISDEASMMEKQKHKILEPVEHTTGLTGQPQQQTTTTSLRCAISREASSASPVQVAAGSILSRSSSLCSSDVSSVVAMRNQPSSIASVDLVSSKAKPEPAPALPPDMDQAQSLASGQHGNGGDCLAAQILERSQTDRCAEHASEKNRAGSLVPATPPRRLSETGSATKRSDSLGCEANNNNNECARIEIAQLRAESANHLQPNDQISSNFEQQLQQLENEQFRLSNIDAGGTRQASEMEPQTTTITTNESRPSSPSSELESSKDDRVRSQLDSASASRSNQMGVVGAPSNAGQQQSTINVVTPIETAMPTSSAIAPATTPGGSRSPIDCPYVHDLLVLSPDPANGESPIQPAASFQQHTARLSHDDTMEAIEDDVEGEELEQQLLLLQQQQQLNSLSGDPCATPPSLPPGFGNPSFENNSPCGVLGNDRALTPADSIKEEDEDILDDFEAAPPPPELPGSGQPNGMLMVSDDDEESSVSVSHRGVLVSSASNTTQTAAALGRQISQDHAITDAAGQEHWPVKSMSNESGTQAILDHLALHELGGDGHEESNNDNIETIRAPEPPVIGQNCEQQQRHRASFSSSPEPATGSSYLGSKRRKSWRQRDNQTDSNDTDEESNAHDIIDNSETKGGMCDPADSINTATMKRRRIKDALSNNREGEVDADGATRSPDDARSVPNHTPTSRNKLNMSDSLETAQGSQEDLAVQRQQSQQAQLLQTQCEQSPDDFRSGPNNNNNEVTTGEDSKGADKSIEQAPPVEIFSGVGGSVARRGPPLAQLRSGQSQTSVIESNNNINNNLNHTDSTLEKQSNNDAIDETAAIGGNNNNYDSICSSCSCRDGSDSLASSSNVTCRKQQPDASSSQAGTSQGKAAWTSQEEGTVFTENYWLSHWLYISEREESEIWRRAIDMTSSAIQPPGDASQPSSNRAEAENIPLELIANLPKEMNELSGTSSESSFNLKYKSTSRKMIHRRATIEMYRRVQESRLAPEKRVEISRSNGEFGFRIHGSRPVVVSAIERGTSAETCGLEVGDLIYAINGTNILEMAHSEVVRLAHNAQSSSLVLDLIPTNDFLRSRKYEPGVNKHYEAHLSGFLVRLSPSTAQPLLVDLQKQLAQSTSGPVSTQQRVAKLTKVLRLAWRRRYFVLRNDNCLYWFKSMNEIEPHGGINLQGFSATVTNEFSEPAFVIRLIKYGGQPHYFGTNNEAEMKLWIDAINKAATEANQNDPYMGRTLKLARLRPTQIEEPDCNGFLYKYSRKRDGGAHWKPIYFVLKEACLYIFRNGPPHPQNVDDPKAAAAASRSGGEPSVASQASAVVYLHGYRVRSKQIGSKRHTFELIPPTRKTMRPIFLMASSEIDKKRWIAALEYTIDRWIEID